MSDDPISKRMSNKPTMAYMFVPEAEARRRHGGGVAPTEEMPALPGPTTVQDIVTLLIEKEVSAWMALPKEVRDMMLTTPALFTIVQSKIPGGMPHISYSGVELRWDGADSWRLVTIRSK